MARILLLVAALLLGGSDLVMAQSANPAPSANPAQSANTTPRAATYKQLIDNERVRVFEATFRPGAKLPSRNYPSHMVYAPSEGTLIFTPAGRRGYEVNFNDGDAMWFGPQARETENDSDREVRILVVEFKDGGGGGGRAAKAARGGKGKARKSSGRKRR